MLVEVGHGGAGTAQAKGLVVAVGTHGVGMAVDPEAHFGELADPMGLLVQDRAGLGIKLGAVEGKVDGGRDIFCKTGSELDGEIRSPAITAALDVVALPKTARSRGSPASLLQAATVRDRPKSAAYLIICPNSLQFSPRRSRKSR